MSLNVHRCCIPLCANSTKVNRDVVHFRFPTLEKTAAHWFSAISKAGGTHDLAVYRKKYVCAEHFLEADFARKEDRKLLRGSVPSQFENKPNTNQEMEDSSCTETTGNVCFTSPLKLTNISDSTLSPSSPHVLHPVMHCYSTISKFDKSGKSSFLSTAFESANTSSTSDVLHESYTQTSTVVTSTPNAQARTKLLFSDCRSVNENSEVLAVPLDSVGECVHKISRPGCVRKQPVKRKWSSFLKSIDSARICDLTPRKAKLHKLLKSKAKALDRLRKMCREHPTRFRSMKNLDRHPLIQEICSKLSSAAGRLLLSQLRCGMQKPKARRWTLDEKATALAILKRSPTAYDLLSCMFVLPTKRTLTTLVNAIPFRTGVDERVFNTIGKAVSKMPERDKFCCLVFDEMSLREHLQYSSVEDRIVGYEDDGEATTPNVANHVLVFMLQGLGKKWKQPVASFFSRGPVKGQALKAALVSVLRQCFLIGLYVIATVCDMGSNNVSALKLLGVKFPNPCFELDGHILAVFFDPPHLLKCIRNMFQAHIVRGVKVKGNSITYVGAARWEHVEKTYEEDKTNSLYRLCPKLTDTNIQPKGSDRMKVSKAAQIMSHSVAAAVHSFVSRGILPVEANVTAAFLAEVDSLFDSFNGRSLYPESGKPLRCRLSESSPHIDFWLEAKAAVHKWEFHYDPRAQARLKQPKKDRAPPKTPGKRKKEVTRPPSQWGWITSINAVLHIWSVLQKAGFEYLQVRALNQDCLENLFGSVRSYCGSNNNPSCYQFISALKTSIINGLAYKDCFRGNCEADEASLLSDLKVYLTGGEFSKMQCDTSFLGGGIGVGRNDRSQRSDEGVEVGGEVCLGHVEEAVRMGDVSVFSVAYVSGYVGRRLLGKLNCKICSLKLTASNEELYNTGIVFKEFKDNQKSLTYPCEKLVICVGECATVFENFIPNISHETHIKENIYCHITRSVDFEWLKVIGICAEHESFVKAEIIKGVCAISLAWWCKRKNRQLVNQNKRKHERKLNILCHT